MPRRPRSAKHAARAKRHQRRRALSRISPTLDGSPGSCHQRRTVIHRIKPQLGDKVIRLDIVAKRTNWPNRWEGLQVCVARAESQPLLPCGLQKSHIGGGVNFSQNVNAVGVGCAYLMATRSQLRQNEIKPGRRLKTRHTIATEELGLRGVKRVLGAGNGDHSDEFTAARFLRAASGKQRPRQASLRGSGLRCAYQNSMPWRCFRALVPRSAIRTIMLMVSLVE